MDGSGIAETESREIGADWFARGCILPRSGATALPGQDAAINPNAVFDAARRLTQCVRLVNRQQFVGYEVVKVAGVQKSVLWFKRRSVYNSGIDLFGGIADRIAATAPQAGWSNEWVLGISLKPYHPSDSSLWKVGAFGDYWSLFNRCLFFSHEVALDTDWLWHVAYGQRLGTLGNMVAEAPSGYNYGRHRSGYINEKLCVEDPECEAQRLAFYKSCRIYEPDVEVESVETVASGGEELVKVTLVGRLHSTYGEAGGAPETFSRDLSAWDGPTIASEPFRTAENAIRLYLVWAATGYNAPAITGDNALTSKVHTSLTDEPYGSIIPHFLFTKLIPQPFDDGNDAQDAHDTPLWSDVWPMMDLYLAAMCGGWVDERSTLLQANPRIVYAGPGPDGIEGTDDDKYDCDTDPHDLFDFTYPNLCLAAFGGATVGILPATVTDGIGESGVRRDGLHGVGPLPGVPASAEVFNRFAASIDLLTRVRLMVPHHWEVTGRLYGSDPDRIVDSAEGICETEGSGCGAVRKFVWQGTGPAATTDLGEITSGGVSGYTYCAFTDGCPGLSGSYWLRTIRATCSFQLAVDDDVVNVFPPAWRDMVTTNTGTLWCRKIAGHRYALGSGSTEIAPGKWFACGINRQVIVNQTSYVFASSGTIDFGPLAPSSVFADYWDGTGDTFGAGSGLWMDMTPLLERSLFLEIPLE